MNQVENDEFGPVLQCWYNFLWPSHQFDKTPCWNSELLYLFHVCLSTSSLLIVVINVHIGSYKLYWHYELQRNEYLMFKRNKELWKLPSWPSETRTYSVQLQHLIVRTLNHSTKPRTHAHNTNYTKWCTNTNISF